MKYTIENYEEFAIDYLEDKLSKDDRQEFEAFLILHPEIKDTLEGFNMVTLPSFQAKLPGKEKLYHNKAKVKPIFYSFRAIAAAIILLVLFGLFIQNEANKIKDQIAVVEVVPNVGITSPPVKQQDPRKDNKQNSEENSSVAETPIVKRKELTKANDEPVQKALDFNSKNSKKEDKLNDVASDFSIPLTDNKIETLVLQPVVYIQNLQIKPEIQVSYKIEHRPTYLFLEQDKKEDTVSKIGKLLAKANLIPTGLREEITESNLREKVIPESYMDLK